MKQKLILTTCLLTLSTSIAFASNDDRLGDSQLRQSRFSSQSDYERIRLENINRQATELLDQANPDLSSVTNEEVLFKYFELLAEREQSVLQQQTQLPTIISSPRPDVRHEIAEDVEQSRQVAEYERIRLENITRQARALLEQDRPDLENAGEAVMLKYFELLAEREQVIQTPTITNNSPSTINNSSSAAHQEIAEYERIQNQNITRQATALLEQTNPNLIGVGEAVLMKYFELLAEREQEIQTPTIINNSPLPSIVSQEESEANEYERIRLENLEREVQALLSQGVDADLTHASEAAIFEYARRLSELQSVVSTSAVEQNRDNRTIRRYNLHPGDQLRTQSEREALLQRTREQAELEARLLRQREQIEMEEAQRNAQLEEAFARAQLHREQDEAFARAEQFDRQREQFTARINALRSEKTRLEHAVNPHRENVRLRELKSGLYTSRNNPIPPRVQLEIDQLNQTIPSDYETNAARLNQLDGLIDTAEEEKAQLEADYRRTEDTIGQ